MQIDIHDEKVQDACFLVFRLLTGGCGRKESERIQKEILVAAAGYMARPSTGNKPCAEGDGRC